MTLISKLSSKRKKNSPGNIYTDDFESMVKCVTWSSTGFFFLEFISNQFATFMDVGGLGVGLIFSLITIGSAIGAIVVGFIGKKVNIRFLIQFGIYGRGISYIILYLGVVLRSFIIYYVGSFLLGFLVIFFWIPYDTLIANKSHKHHRSKAYSKRDLAVGIGMLVGGVIGIAIFGLGNYFCPDNLFVVYAALPFFMLTNFYAAFLFSRNIDEKKIYIYEEPTSQDDEFKENSQDLKSADENQFEATSLKKILNKIPKSLKVGVIFLLCAFLIGSINESIAKPFQQLFIIENLTQDPFLVVLLYLPSGLVAPIFAPAIGKLADKVPHAIGLSLTLLLGAIVTLMVVETRIFWLFSLLLLLDQAIAMGEKLIMDNFLSRISVNHRMAIFNLRDIFLYVGRICGPVIGGLLWDSFGYKFPFLLSVFVELSLIPIMIIAIKLIKPQMEEA